MQSDKRNFFDKILQVLYYAILLFVPLMLLISEIKDENPLIQADIVRNDSRIDSLQTFPKAVVLASGKIDVKYDSPVMRYMAPRPHTDPLYLTLFFFGAVIIAVFFGNFSYKKPFTKKTLLGLRIGCVLLFIFFIGNFIRYGWFNDQVQKMTNYHFHFDNPGLFGTPEFWILFILIRLVRLFKKGVALQSEIDLTV